MPDNAPIRIEPADSPGFIGDKAHPVGDCSPGGDHVSGPEVNTVAQAHAQADIARVDRSAIFHHGHILTVKAEVREDYAVGQERIPATQAEVDQLGRGRGSRTEYGAEGPAHGIKSASVADNGAFNGRIAADARAFSDEREPDNRARTYRYIVPNRASLNVCRGVDIAPQGARAIAQSVH